MQSLLLHSVKCQQCLTIYSDLKWIVIYFTVHFSRLSDKIQVESPNQVVFSILLFHILSTAFLNKTSIYHWIFTVYFSYYINTCNTTTWSRAGFRYRRGTEDTDDWLRDLSIWGFYYPWWVLAPILHAYRGNTVFHKWKY